MEKVIGNTLYRYNVENGKRSVDVYSLLLKDMTCARYNQGLGLYEAFSHRIDVGDYNDWQIYDIIKEMGVEVPQEEWYQED